jgi:hypothetical protein
MNKNKNKSPQKELLINNSGMNKYSKPKAVNKLLRYIARENDHSNKDDLICKGALGATDFTDIETTIKQFECVQLLHTRRGDFGRYIDHEIYSFSDDEEALIEKNHVSIEELARKIAFDFYRDGYQVYYGVHKKDETDSHLHIHFAINTVNFKTGNKRHENKTETRKRQQRLAQIVTDAISES